MACNKHGEVTGGIFLIGLAILFLTGFWFPGILFLIGFVAITNGLTNPRERDSLMGGMFLIGLGLIFWVGFNLGLVLLMIGIGLLLSALFKGSKSAELMEKPKRKHGEFV